MGHAHALIATLRRAYRHSTSEQRLLTTFWPSDYRVGSELRRNGRSYRVTRYERAANGRFFEVWGNLVGNATPLLPDNQNLILYLNPRHR